jgi:hypothetical protein
MEAEELLKYLKKCVEEKLGADFEPIITPTMYDPTKMQYDVSFIIMEKLIGGTIPRFTVNVKDNTKRNFKNLQRVTRYNLFCGMNVQDSKSKKGIVRDCKDLHNVHITFEGEGIMIDWYKTPFECGGSGLYCFAENCEDNCEYEDPLYYYETK